MANHVENERLCVSVKMLPMFSTGVKNVFLTKDMKYTNVSMPWNPSHYAMVPQLVEEQLTTEKVPLSF